MFVGNDANEVEGLIGIIESSLLFGSNSSACIICCCIVGIMAATLEVEGTAGVTASACVSALIIVGVAS